MDIHRCRFVPYQPSAINAIAFSHARIRQGKKVSLARLAIGRANGDIEIWNPHEGSWHQELIIRGGKDRSIDSLVWVNEPDQDLGDGRILHGKSRLFSIGYTSTVTEWDLEKGKPKRHASGQHGDIWCMAAQPSSNSDPTQGTKLVAGTMDGELVLYSIEDDDLRFQRVVVKSATKKAQIVSIAFQSSKVAIVGCSDSTIRAYNMSKGQLLRRMTLGADVIGGSKNIIVWSVKCLPNGNIVSGDSTGQVCIWDGKTYTQSQRMISHKADVLSLAISADGNSILSGGMDRRTVLHRPATGSHGRWTKAWGRRYHEHDVKAMATFEGGNISVVITGGPDARPVVLPLKDLGRNNHRTLPSLPLQPPVLGAAKARFLLSWWDRELHIWTLPATAEPEAEDGKSTQEDRKLLKTILVKGDSNITSASINRNGTLLFIATGTDIKAFRLEHSKPLKPADVTLTTLDLPERVAQRGATRITLSPDERWLSIIREGTQVTVAQLIADDEEIQIRLQQVRRLHRDIPRYVANGGLRSYDRNITQACFSPDSKMLAVADIAGYIDTWILSDNSSTANSNVPSDDDDASSGDESSDGEAADNGSEQWRRNPTAKLLPKLPSAPVVLSFSGDCPLGSTTNNSGSSANDYTLLAITSSWYILTFHPLQGQLTDWSRRNPRKTLPGPIRDLLDLAQGVFWEGSRVWVYGISFLFMIDTSQDMPTLGQVCEAQENGTKGTKRKRTGPITGAGGKMAKGNTVPHQVLRHTGKKAEDLDMEGEAEDSDVNSDEEMEEANGELSELRQSNDQQSSQAVVSTDGQKRWWITHKYRPVLGMVALSDPGQPLEVALVERPTWDVEMAEKYYAGNEYRR
ncbi:hypothetical protein NLU13_1302 [Sarocladium strictum]|uniref:Wdr1p n=1 Tax=Sarocladium strictum TaxID=5046 RepID=A0AA39LC36_SARSR|nr:hypothetical protein NLU13_1302 [Sarocladium strictum]